MRHHHVVTNFDGEQERLSAIVDQLTQNVAVGGQNAGQPFGKIVEADGWFDQRIQPIVAQET
jgi:hypothetical protein